MANKAKEYPDIVLCPLLNAEIADFECLETQSCADGEIQSDTLPNRYKQHTNWRQICQDCKYHEID